MNVHIDVCHSNALALMRVAYHQQLKRAKITMEKVDAAAVEEFQTLPPPKHHEVHITTLTEPDLWVVRAES